MRLVVVAVLTLAAVVAGVDVISSRGYHEDVGMPLAAEIKEKEELMLANQRIIGGVLAPANAHPYYVGLLIDLIGWAGQSVCGASLLNSNRMVTAAHCWFDGVNQAWQFTTILGTQQLYFGGTRISTSQVIMHPQWTPYNLLNDVAMIFLPSHVSFSVSIQPVQLPSASDWANPFIGEWANAVGFGRTSDSQAGASSILSHVNLQVISVEQCRAIYGTAFVFDSTLCTNGAGRVGVCSGDSGGPLVLQRNGQNILIGVTSFAADRQCEGGFPSGFARVTSFINFIQQYLW